MKQKENNLSMREATIRIKILAQNDSDAFDGIGSILNRSMEDGEISDWEYASECTCAIESVSFGETRIDVDVPNVACSVHGLKD